MSATSHDPITYFWHDYETFGIDPRRDRPAQFAGLRTDADFTIIDDPVVFYCRPADDYLPHPDSCLITGISPQLALEKGVCEAEFMRRIHAELAEPNTCTLGYNNLRFDDEFTRNGLYRNFYDAYAREWQNGNSRWDLIDVARAARALRPDGINWPVNEDGKPSLKLDQLTVANGISHENAHDALADVIATIEFAKLIKQAQPKLFEFLLKNRSKQQVLDLLQLGSFKPVVHISGMFKSENNSLAIVLPLCKHPTNSNGVIVYDLSVDPEPLLSLSAEDIQHRLYTAASDLPEGMARVPLKTVHINKCPVLAPLGVIKPEDEKRLNLDLNAGLANRDKIAAAPSLAGKLATVFDHSEQFESATDPDLMLYSGGFFSDVDKQTLAKIRQSAPEKLQEPIKFTDRRLSEMLFRYRARNYPETLNAKEKADWKSFCRQRLTGQQGGAGITFEAYFARLNELRNETSGREAILDALAAYGTGLMDKLGVDRHA